MHSLFAATLSDCHHNLALLLVGFQILVSTHYGFQRKGAINDGFQCAGLKPVIDVPFAAGKLLGIFYNFKQGITSYY